MLTKDNVKLISHITEDYQNNLNEEFNDIMEKIHKERRSVNGASILVLLATSIIFFGLVYIAIGDEIKANNDELLVLLIGLTMNFALTLVYRKIVSRERGSLYKDEVNYFHLRQINHSTIKYIDCFLPAGEVQIVKKFKDEDYVILNIIDDKKRERDAKVALVMNVIDSDRNELELFNDHIDAYINKELQASIQ